MWYVIKEDELYHHGVKGQKWGVRRYQNPDGTLTEAGKKRQNKLNAEKDRYENTIWTADEKHAHGEIGDRKHGRITANAVKRYNKATSKAKYQDAKADWKNRTKDTKKPLYANKVEAKAAYKASRYTKKEKIDKAAAKVYAQAMLKKRYVEVVTDKAVIERGTAFTAKAVRMSQQMAAAAAAAAGYAAGAGQPRYY